MTRNRTFQTSAAPSERPEEARTRATALAAAAGGGKWGGGTSQPRPGPVVAHLVVGDEINRASPTRQTALLELRQEAQATGNGWTYRLPHPALVPATQNLTAAGC